MKLFADRKRSALLAGAPTQLSVNPVRLFALLAAVVVIASSTLALAQAGTLDTTFGTGGIFGTSFTQNGAADNAIAIQSDGKIIVGGLIALSTGGGQAALLRLNTNGTLDSSFGTGGIV